MDVRISVSLMRDQLGAVIEQAVAAAVDTVLGEMVRVVGSKLEEFSKEISAKEKENESMKQMLEISRCQMKTLRKYLSAVGAKDERHVVANQRRPGGQSEPSRTFCPSVGDLQHSPDLKRTRKGGDGNFTVNGKAQRLLINNRSAYTSECLATAAPSWEGLIKNAHELAQEPAARESKDSFDPCHSVEREGHVIFVKEERRDFEDRDCYPRREEGEEAVKQPTPSQGEYAEPPSSDPPSHLTTGVTALANRSALAAGDPAGGSPMAKEEDAGEIEVICIKEEPAEQETRSPSPQRPEPWCGPTGTTRPENPSFTSVTSSASLTSSAYAGVLTALSGAQRQARWRQRQRDAGAQREAERSGQRRRREREKSLPQPLLAALERERREKTRIRVARWRAKRKLLASQAAHLDCRPAQTTHARPSNALRCHQLYSATPQFGGLLYGSPHCENSAPYPPLHLSANPLLPGLGQDMTDTVVLPGMTSTQQGILGADSELFQ